MNYDRMTSRATALGTVDRADEFPVPAEGMELPTPGLIGVVAAAFKVVAGVVRDRATVSRLRRLPDRVLGDMGLCRDTLAADLAAARRSATARRGDLVSQRLAAWREERRIYGELSSYSDAELAEIGMGRGDVRAAARGHAILHFRDAGLVEEHFRTDGRLLAANQAAKRRAA